MPDSPLRSQFLLNPEITYLNFGSFGACARPVFEDYQRWQAELEFEPVAFITVNGPKYLQRSREALASYIHCQPEDIVYVMNPSYGVNIVAKSLDLSPGDEILSTDLEYGACDRTWNYYCQKKGARYVRQPINLPIVSKDQFVEDFFKGLSAKTKAIFISHITSATALRLPVEEICAIAKEKGLLTIVDGAHVPGHLPLDLSRLQADIYTGACHKWMCTPKGCTFLYINKEWQDRFDPLLVSWGYDAAKPAGLRFQDFHTLQGTRDISAFLTVPRALQFMEENNWVQVAADCRRLVQENALRFCELLGATPISPVNDEFLGQMFSIPLKASSAEALHDHLYSAFRIQVPINNQDGQLYLRYSINGFNNQEDLDKLYDALKTIKAEGKLIYC